MRKSLRELHRDIQYIMEFTKEDLEQMSSEQLLEYSKYLKHNKETIDAERMRYIGRNNVQANIKRRIADIDMQIENINYVFNLKNPHKTNNHINIISNTHNTQNTQNIQNIQNISTTNNYNFQTVINKSDINNNYDDSNLDHPFKNEETFKLFEHIVKNWDYNYGQKWADIWNALRYSEDNKYNAPLKIDYQKYIIKKYRYTGKFQYDKMKNEKNLNYIKLLDIIKKFSEK